jgi:hypothetical protein
MESFHISSELIDESSGEISQFGNMKVYNNGWITINKKMCGLYFTLSIILGIFGIAAYLMLDTFIEEEKIVLISIFSFSTLVIFGLSLWVSISNPGFYKPETRDLEKDANISKVFKLIQQA